MKKKESPSLKAAISGSTNSSIGASSGQIIAPTLSVSSSIPVPPASVQTPPDEKTSAAIKEIENAIFAIRFYPVAVSETSKDAAVSVLLKIYREKDETLKQLIIYTIHENICHYAELKFLHTFDFFKSKTPNADPSAMRMNVYRAIFNYDSSMEGICELISLLGKLGADGGTDCAKVLTYHFSHLCSFENEISHMLRAAVLEALGECNSKYALKSLLDYARLTDSERTFHRILSALAKFSEKLDTLKLGDREKEKYRSQIQELLSSDFGSSHYG
ncbi:hypothetical protein HY990_05250 [Candidatus Micrarchaeota archaeon]|nr:hypothetical protein [Candidatus Micrarchaeota archaeon]